MYCSSGEAWDGEEEEEEEEEDWCCEEHEDRMGWLVYSAEWTASPWAATPTGWAVAPPSGGMPRPRGRATGG